MSLIAVTYNDCYEGHPAIPFLIGDILFSTPDAKPNISIPTFLDGADRHLPEDQKYFPSSLEQKLYVINDCIAIALAGSKLEMKKVLIDVIDYFRNRESTIQNLQDLYLSKLRPGYSECSYCILFKETDNNLKILRHGQWKEVLTQTFGTVIATASGDTDFIEFVSNLEVPPFTDSNIAYEAFRRNVISLGQFFGREKLAAETLYSYWGGYFEIILLENNKFKKYDNLTFLFKRAIIDVITDEENVSPLFICNGCYQGDLLIVNAINCTEENRSKTFIVPPLNFDKENIDTLSLPPVDFESDEVCLTYLFEFSNGVEFNTTYLLFCRP